MQNNSCIPSLLTLSRLEDIYQLDDSRYFRLLNFVDVLATHEYKVGYGNHRHIGAKLVSIPKHPTLESPCPWNYFYDYVVSVRDPGRNYISQNIDSCKIDFGIYPDVCKVHCNPHFTQLVAGHAKIDLLLEEHQKKAPEPMAPVLLLYPTSIDYSMSLQSIGPEKYVELWC